MTDDSVSGLDLARRFYAEAVEPLVDVPHAAALLGEGSEVLGFDTLRSRDHEWGPRVQILVADEHVSSVDGRMRDLPAEFAGFPTRWFSLSAGTVTHHVEVVTVDDWVVRTVGFDPRRGMDAADWLGVPQQRLLHATAGEVFRDDDGALTDIRDLLTWYPDDVWAWMMLTTWHLIGAAEPLRGRCIETGDVIGSRLLTARLCRLAMELVFLQERAYWPYDKWFGAAFARLLPAAQLAPLLDRALTARGQEAATAALHELFTRLGERQNRLSLGSPVRPRLAPFDVGINGAIRPYLTINAGEFVESLRGSISDPSLRALVPVGSLDQLTHADDAVVTHTDWPARLSREYRDALTGET